MNLVVASYLGKFDEIKKSIEEEKQDVNQVDEYGDTPLHLAVAKGRFEIVKYLIEKGTIIITVVIRSCFTFIGILLDLNSDISINSLDSIDTHII